MPEEIPSPLTKEETEQAIVKGIDAWMDKKFAELGKWSFRAALAAALGALAYFIAAMNGWHKG